MKKIKFISYLLVSVVGISSFTGCTFPKTLKETSKQIADENNSNYTGTIEVKETNVASKLAGRVQKVLVKENQQVKAGDIIAVITSDDIKAKEKQAQAVVDAAKIQLQQAQKTVTMQEEVSKSNSNKANAALEQAKYQYEKAQNGARTEEVNQAQASYDYISKTYERMKKLADAGAISSQTLDETQTQLNVAKQKLEIAKAATRPEDLKAAQAMIEQAQAAVDAANTGSIQIEIAIQNVTAAKAKYEQALGALQEVRSYLKDTNIVAPLTGTITLLNTKEGELVSTGYPIAVVSDLTDMWVNVKIRETEFSKFVINKKLQVTTPAYVNQTFDGIVSNIDKKADFAAKRSTNERDEKDIISFNVKVKLDNTKGNLRPGLTAYIKLNNN